MRLCEFIQENHETIIQEWVVHSTTKDGTTFTVKIPRHSVTKSAPTHRLERTVESGASH